MEGERQYGASPDGNGTLLQVGRARPQRNGRTVTVEPRPSEPLFRYCDSCWAALPEGADACIDCGRTLQEMAAAREAMLEADRRWKPARLRERPLPVPDAPDRPAAAPRAPEPPDPEPEPELLIPETEAARWFEPPTGRALSSTASERWLVVAIALGIALLWAVAVSAGVWLARLTFPH